MNGYKKWQSIHSDPSLLFIFTLGILLVIVFAFLTLCMLAKFSWANFFQKNYFRNCIIVSNGLDQVRTDILSVFIWIQTVCKVYQQTTKVAASKERVIDCIDMYKPHLPYAPKCNLSHCIVYLAVLFILHFNRQITKIF